MKLGGFLRFCFFHFHVHSEFPLGWFWRLCYPPSARCSNQNYDSITSLHKTKEIKDIPKAKWHGWDIPSPLCAAKAGWHQLSSSKTSDARWRGFTCNTHGGRGGRSVSLSLSLTHTHTPAHTFSHTYKCYMLSNMNKCKFDCSAFLWTAKKPLARFPKWGHGGSNFRSASLITLIRSSGD